MSLLNPNLNLNLNPYLRLRITWPISLYCCAFMTLITLTAGAKVMGVRIEGGHDYAGILSQDPSMRFHKVEHAQKSLNEKLILPMREKDQTNGYSQHKYVSNSYVDHIEVDEEASCKKAKVDRMDTAVIDRPLNLHWSSLPALPNQTGVAGAFVGVSGDALLVAGGANFPNGGAPWKGSRKVWYDTIYVLDDLKSKWQVAGHLPKALGYGVTVNWKGQMIIIGGSNEKGYYSEVLRLKYSDGTLDIDRLPDLPTSIANMAGALVGNCIYIAGGQLSPDALSASSNCWRLNLVASMPVWEKLPALPGEGRMLSVAGSLDGRFFLFSGTALRDGKRAYLRDAFCYHPQRKAGKEIGWKSLAPLPNPVVGAPGPAFLHANELFVFGGDDGKMASQATELKNRHPGFSTVILGYRPLANKWRTAGNCWTDKKEDAVSHPNGSIWAPVTTGLTIWKGAVIIAGGEVRPSTRTPRVLMGTIL